MKYPFIFPKTQLDATKAADERAIQIYLACQRGQSYASIGADHNVSPKWVKQLFKRGRKLLLDKDNPLNELSMRVRNILITYQCGSTPTEIAQWFTVQPARHVSTMINFGASSQAELNAWLLRHGQQPIKGYGT